MANKQGVGDSVENEEIRMENRSVPDIEFGHAIVGGNLHNSWRTEIRSVLARKREGRLEFSYLTHECRAECVGFDKIFHDQIYEYAAVRSWREDENYIIRHGRVSRAAAYEKKTSDELGIRIICPERTPNWLSFPDVLDVCQNGGDVRIFLKIQYIFSGVEYISYVPARYINFPNARISEDTYLQPISGFSLFYDGEGFRISYVAAHIRENGETHVEFIVRGSGKGLWGRSFPNILGKIVRKNSVLSRGLFPVGDFDTTYVVDGCVEFYSFENKYRQSVSVL